ncbi:MAG: hypothetical protein P8174_00820 [Gemmatimonadota bacterium]|jgi:hypothetical protein
MAKMKILKKDGTPSSYFWSDDDGSGPTRKRVYRETSGGVKRMRGVRFDSVKNRMRRHPER